MSPSNSISKHHAGDLERQSTVSPRDQPAMPYVPRNLANPMPLGLLAFATSLFTLSLFELHPRGVQHNNIVITNMIFFGGVSQVIAGIMEFFTGNTFGATVFNSYGAFNLAYALIYLPGSGIIDAYIDPETSALSPEFNQAVAMFVWGWFIMSVIFTLAAVRSSWVLLIALVFVDLCLMLIACGQMVDNEEVLKASAVFGLVAAALAYYAGAAGLFGNGVTPFNLPLGPLAPKRE
ncbi:GPR1/FUN34/yaaH family-domain-containing protein [Xylariomycetidae sp. FL2044]|nr:GPR1/FUN34/yaaH family-domain-containing protein [Xylariomycetidae sp. FL2044]